MDRAQAAEIKVLSAGAVRAIVTDLAAAFRQETGHTATLTFGTVGVMRQKLTASPAVSFWRMTPTVPNVNVAVCPVSCRNAAARSVTIARTAPALSTLISAACARSMPRPQGYRHQKRAQA